MRFLAGIFSFFFLTSGAHGASSCGELINGKVRTVFLERPRLSDTQSGDWTKIIDLQTRSFDAIMSGRKVDYEVVYEVNRFGLGNRSFSLHAGELAAWGIISAEAIKQISTNGNYKGSNLNLLERLAFALAIGRHEEMTLPDSRLRDATRFLMSYDSNYNPLRGLWTTLEIKTPFETWSANLVSEARELLRISVQGKLLDGDLLTERLKSR
ncbi:MAG: hypothetical protein ABL958_10660, partial [Bdellovibrionia bacterium]